MLTNAKINWLVIIYLLGTLSRSGSYFGKPDKTVHLSNVQCIGDEGSIGDCTKTSYSLEQGKTLQTAVAGVTCYIPDGCIAPPTGESEYECGNGQVKLTGNNANDGEGVLHYCYKGLWSTFCSLSATEATIACRQLGFTDYNCEQTLL